jgi:toxin ParE1/3/4
MKKYKVFVVEEAETDLFEIHNYISIHDSERNASIVIDSIEEACLRLETFPNRGRIVPELRKINITSFFEIIHKPFRIIYQIIDNLVYIHAILDSRRDLEELLYNKILKI